MKLGKILTKLASCNRLKTTFSVLIILLAIGVASTIGAEEKKKKNALKGISDGLNEFSNNLLKVCQENR